MDGNGEKRGNLSTYLICSLHRFPLIDLIAVQCVVATVEAAIGDLNLTDSRVQLHTPWRTT